VRPERRQQVTGPSWLESDRFDIAAKAPDGVPAERVPALLQHLLADRFKLAVRVERREMAIYALLAGNGQHGLQKAEDGPPAPGRSEGITIRDGSTRGMALVESYRATLARFAGMLSNLMDRLVVDQTGIEGPYNFAFEVSSDGFRFAKPGALPAGEGANPEAGPAPDGTPGGNLFGSIQKLGLRLEPRKAPVDFVIVDGGQRVPTEN
jgi:uncharacterized protein (TIGR03435 family)